MNTWGAGGCDQEVGLCALAVLRDSKFNLGMFSLILTVLNRDSNRFIRIPGKDC